MNDITFGFLLSIIALGIALPIAGRLWPEQPDSRPWLRDLIGAAFSVGVIMVMVTLIAPPLFRWLLREHPLLLARFSYAGVGVAMLIGGAWLVLFEFAPKSIAAIRRRWNDAQYLDEKLGGAALNLIVLGFSLTWLVVPALFVIGLAREWNNMALWEDMIAELHQPPEEMIVNEANAYTAARATCLYDNQALTGPCVHRLPAGAIVFPYWLPSYDAAEQRIRLDQTGPARYVVSLDLHSLLETGWARRADLRPSYDSLTVLGGVASTLVRPEALQSLAVDLATGLIVSLVIVWLTQGAAEHYLLSLAFIISMASMAARYSIGGGMLIPSFLLWLMAIPMAIGSAVESELIKLVRRLGR